MKILVIEDNSLKREKIVDFFVSKYMAEIAEAASYNSGLAAAWDERFDLLVLDMSMPTFDRSETTQGGRFRTLAGKEVATKLKKGGKLVPFVVLTGYKDFSVESKSLSIQQIHDLLVGLGEDYKGCIVFNSADVHWQEELKIVVESVGC